MMLRLLLIFSFALNIMASDTEPRELEYCHKKLCINSNTSHIACDNAANFLEDCSSHAHLLPSNRRLRHLILTKHNNQRSRLAMGLGHFTAATRMATMSWSSELAFLAELNVKRCHMKRSECTATARYPNIGQNMAYNRFQGEQTANEIVSSQISMWFDEYLKADMSSILTGETHHHVINSGEIKHFLQLARDRADRVGCAVARYKDIEGWTIQHMTCLYNVGVDNCYPIYMSSDVGGKGCQTGISKKYPFLCNTHEKYDYITCPSAGARSKSVTTTCAPDSSSEGPNRILKNIRLWWSSHTGRHEQKQKSSC